MSSERLRSAELPQELIDAIIDNVGCSKTSSRRSTLLSCHRASRSLCLRARHYLFSELTICVDHGLKGFRIDVFTKLREIMGRSGSQSSFLRSGIAPWVKKFKLVITGGEANRLVVGLDSHLGAIFHALASKEYGVSDVFLSFPSEGLDWASLTPGLKTSFTELFRSPHLRNLHITALYHVPAQLFNGSHIRHLQWYQRRSTFAALIPTGPLERDASFPIKTLDVDWAFLSQWHPELGQRRKYGPIQAMFPRVEALSAWVETAKDYQSLQNLFSTNPRTLEFLELRFAPRFPLASPSPFELKELPRLRHLKFTHVREPSAWLTNCDIEIEKMAHLLRRCTNNDIPAPFTTLEIDLSINEWDPGRDFFQPQQSQQWSLLSNILCQMPFRGLHNFILNIKIRITRLLHGASFDEDEKEFVESRRESLKQVFKPFVELVGAELTIRMIMTVKTF